MRTINFAKRNFKEIIREPLSIVFAIILPLFLLFIFQQFEIPNDVYKIENFTPSILVFSFTFITLFTSSLVAQDRSTSLLTRLCTSPMKPYEYICGYMIAILPLILIQNILFFTVGALLGLNISINILLTILVSIPVSILFILLGILIGCMVSAKAAPGVSSVVVQLVAFTSGMYFSSDMIGGFFSTICKILPFESTVKILNSILNNSYNNFTHSLLMYIVYTVLILIITVVIFKKRLESDNK